MAEPERSVRITSQWRAVNVPPGTPYPDEPSEMIPVGWYVLGGGTFGDDFDDRGADVVIRIEEARDEDDRDVCEAIAELVAEVLRAATAVQR